LGEAKITYRFQLVPNGLPIEEQLIQRKRV
jgi:hypothetical protein